jgi:uncharacterized protein (DUF1697 family)
VAGTRYAAFLRGISPMNATMSGLRGAFEAAGFDDVSTVIASGNVVLAARKAAHRTLERRAERAMDEALGRSFLTIVRSIAELQEMLDDDPFARFRLRPKEKLVVTFLREPTKAKLKLPFVKDGARVLAATPTEVYTAYVMGPRGGEFMRVLEEAYGEEITTRSWDTVMKVVHRGAQAVRPATAQRRRRS